ncbi:uncharacterized protein F5891DRAFT_1193211 [Suillus fuscotomentosus]|uniref:Uncharacterized protein n=1 Tax=Suillus fuscotomentosus TaxID=1912939 RepID=A0AAD4HG55_9AGAM|nr:uncharacterized protein F5891DRAFT_1193211 [Suillus fuscotomentosus]KAG1896400.1 hypothetical protein F5891DRAFT_1193211 [Suillus fuscotomentosus]
MSSLQQADIVFLASLAVHQSPIGLTYDCAVCGGALPLTICRSDRSGNSGKPMARHGSCAFFRWFPQLLSHPDIMALIPGGSPTLGAASAAPFPSTQPLPSSSQLQPNNKKSHKRGEPCIGTFCRRPCALQCPHGKCLSHCTTDDGGCPVHVTDSADNQCPQADVQQDWDWGFDQDTLADLETHWHDLSLDAGAEMNDGLRALQHALQSAGASGQPVFPSFHDILTAPVQPPAPSQQPQASLPPLSQPPHLLTLSQNYDASAMHAFPIHTPSKPPPADLHQTGSVHG